MGLRGLKAIISRQGVFLRYSGRTQQSRDGDRDRDTQTDGDRNQAEKGDVSTHTPKF